MLPIYKNALKGCYLHSTCVNNIRAARIVDNAKHGNRRLIIKIALMAGIIDAEEAKCELQCNGYNPYVHQRTEKYIIYNHSGINYFIKPYDS